MRIWALLLLASFSGSAATLQLQHGIEISSIDGHAVSPKQAYQLAGGAHRLTLSVQQLIDDGQAAPARLHLPKHQLHITLQEQEQYLLLLPQLGSADERRRFITAPYFLLSDSREHIIKVPAFNTDAKVPARRLPAANLAEQKLHYWWQRADAKTRARFKAWLSKQ